MRNRARFVVLALPALALLATAAQAARVAVDSSWMPLQEGNRWSYRVNKQRVYTIPDVGSQTMRVEGANDQEVTRPLPGFAGARRAFEVVHHMRDVDAATGVANEGNQTLVLSTSSGPLLMHTGTLDDRPIRILRPVTMLPAGAAPGATWDAGKFEMGGLVFSMQGEALGYEDVTAPAGRFRRCLKVRYIGEVGGEIVMQGVAVAVRGASYQALEWFASGVGSVREESLLKMDLAMPGGNVVHGEEVSTRVLDAFSVGAVAPAARAPR